MTRTTIPPAPQQDRRVVMTVPEAGELLGISRQSAYEAARRGDIPTIKVGSLIKVPVVRFERMLAGDDEAAK